MDRSWSRVVGKLLTVAACDAFHGFNRCRRRRCRKMESDEETGEVCNFSLSLLHAGYGAYGTGCVGGLIAMAKGSE